MELVKHPPAYQFKRPFWIFTDRDFYLSTKRIPDNYEVVKGV